jgi:hypothetical protein
MVKVSSKYNPKFAEYLKSVGGKWDPKSRSWDVPVAKEEVEAKARELNVQDLKIEAAVEEPTVRGAAMPSIKEAVVEAQIRESAAKEAPAEGAIRMKMSRDGRFVLISINLLAFAEDVKQMLEGKRRSVRFRVLPPRS